MKLTIDTKNFTNAVAWAAKSYDAKDTNAYIAFVAKKNGEAYLSYTSLDRFSKCDMIIMDTDFSDTKKSEVFLPLDGRFLIKLQDALSGEQIILSKDLADESSELIIKTPASRFTVPVLAKKAPHLPTLIEIGEVDDREFFSAMRNLASICDTKDSGTNGAIENIHMTFDLENNKIALMGTDRFVIGEQKVSFAATSDAEKYCEDQKTILVPAAAAKMIAPSSGLLSSVTLVHDEESKKFGYLFADGRVALYALSAETKFIKYEGMKKAAIDETVHSTTIQLDELMKAIRNVNSLAKTWDDDRIVFDISEGGFFIKDSFGKNLIEIDADTSGIEETYEIKFLDNVINKSFKPLNTAKVRLQWKDASRPVVMIPVLDDDTISDSVFVLTNTYKDKN